MSEYKVSVAMTLYNGEKFLTQQLESLLLQTHPIDELIACDDGSVDATETIFKEFITRNHLEDKWRYIRNETNLGAMKNFIHAASLCSGDIIFFCDQDDEWDKDKTALMTQVFVDHADALVVSCSEVYMDSKGVFLEGQSKLHKDRDKKEPLEKISFQNQVRTMHSPGLTLAFRKSFIDETASLTYEEDLTYDITMGLVAAAKGGMYRLYRPLVHRRIHEANYSNPELSLSARVKNYAHHVYGRKLQLHHMEVIYQKYRDKLSETDRKNLHKRISDTRKTIEYLEKKSVIGLIRLCFSSNPMNNKKLNVANALIALMVKFQ